MFHVGQKVECVKTINMADVAFGEILPLKGSIYTVREIDSGISDGGASLRLEEIINEKHYYVGGMQECSFMHHGFRPIVARKTDISVFTALLNPTPQTFRESVGYDLGFSKEEIGSAS